MKKGISLAIDTTIIIILAVVVLAVLIGIFFMAVGPTQTEIGARLKQTQACNTYRGFDADCDGKEYNDYIKNSDNEKLLKELGTACSTLKASGCYPNTASRNCVFACCTGCQNECTKRGGGCLGGCPDNLRIPEGDVSCGGLNPKCCR